MKMLRTTLPVPVAWIDDPNIYPNDLRIHRGRVDPNARQGHLPVTLAWLKKHAVGVTYEIRWWDGPTGDQGQWRTVDFSDDVTHAELRSKAAEIAARETSWEVEVRMRARTHGDTGWEYCNRVWSLGHAKRMTEDAKKVRGEE